MSQADPGGTQGRLPLHFEHFALTRGTLRVELRSWMKTPILRTLFQLLTRWSLVPFEMPFLASSYSSRKVKASHKACVLLALCRHLRALHMVHMCASPTGAPGSVCGGLSSQHSQWRAGQPNQQSPEGSSPATPIWLPLVCILLWHCSPVALWVECSVVVSVIACGEKKTEKRLTLFPFFFK